jgi:hypothetical protein
MSDGAHIHASRHLTLDDVQTIIGRAMVDEAFRAAFTADAEGTLKKLGISLNTGSADDAKSVALIQSIAEALKDGNADKSLQDTLQKLRDSYLDSSDGIIRPRCI